MNRSKYPSKGFDVVKKTKVRNAPVTVPDTQKPNLPIMQIFGYAVLQNNT